jgi:hypothetical protein
MVLYALIRVIGETPETMQSWQDSASAGKGNAAEVLKSAEKRLQQRDLKVRH